MNELDLINRIPAGADSAATTTHHEIQLLTEHSACPRRQNDWRIRCWTTCYLKMT